MIKMQQALSWFQGQSVPRQWQIAAAASMLLGAVAAALLYLIHLTTPALPPGLIRTSQTSADAADVFARRATGPAPSAGPIARAASEQEPAANEALPRGEAPEVTSAPSARAIAARPPASPASPADRPAQRGAIQRDAPAANQAANTRHPGNAAGHRAGAAGALRNTVAARQPAATSRLARLAGTPSNRATSAREPLRPAMSAVRAGRDRPPGGTHRTVVSRPTPAAPSIAQAPVDVGVTQVADSSAEMSRSLVAAVVSPAAAARAGNRNLHATMVGECIDTAFLNRLICEQRVRLGYCRERWNQHADCMVDPPPSP